ncbi:MAG: hypothetical protein KJO12_00765, partial [Ignavibacteria bacterium]|nr:hypothetical protein [Ignavibacteria bacterium]
MNNSSNLIIEALVDQKEIFGDDLFETINLDNNDNSLTNNVKEETNFYMPNNLMFEDFVKCTSLDSLYDSIHECKKCALGDT